MLMSKRFRNWKGKMQLLGDRRSEISFERRVSVFRCSSASECCCLGAISIVRFGAVWCNLARFDAESGTNFSRGECGGRGGDGGQRTAVEEPLDGGQMGRGWNASLPARLF